MGRGLGVLVTDSSRIAGFTATAQITLLQYFGGSSPSKRYFIPANFLHAITMER
jgi:hypothetical protein